MTVDGSGDNGDRGGAGGASDAKDVTDGKGGVKFGTGVAYDDAYAAGGDGDDGEFVTELPTLDEERRMFADADRDDDVRRREEMEMDDEGVAAASHPSTLAARGETTERGDGGGEDADPFAGAEGGSGLVNTVIADRETEYQKRRRLRMAGLLNEDGTVSAEGKGYKEIMMERERQAALQQQQAEGGAGAGADGGDEKKVNGDVAADEAPKVRRRRRRWDDTGGGGDADSSSKSEPPAGPTENGGGAASSSATTVLPTAPPAAVVVSDTEGSTASGGAAAKSRWDDDSTGSAASEPPRRRPRKRWDETPLSVPGSTTASAAATSAPDATPLVASAPDATPLVTGGGSKWDETPLVASSAASSAAAATTGRKKSRWDSTPMVAPSSAAPHPDVTKALLTATPAAASAGFQMSVPPEELDADQREREAAEYGVSLQPTAVEMPGGLPHIKRDDVQYFGKLLQEVADEELSKEELKERQISTLLLKIKCGTPPQRKTAMRQITDRARYFGAAALFNQILPLLMSPTLEDQERHLLVKVIDRVLYKLDDLVRPFVQRILAVIEPLLIDEDYYARVEGREIISNLAKAAGLPTMIATMRPDIDNPDEYVRNTTSRAFAVVASALGVPALLPFLKAVCRSRKSWQARHTGIKIVQQVAILMGCAVLPHLRDLVEIVSHGLVDEHRKIRTITALTLAALAESSYPYGIESFDSVIRPLWKGALEHHSKGLAAFLKAIGFVIPLMEENYAAHYTRLIMPILIREFGSPDEEMKRIVLRVVQQCVATAGVEPEYIRKDILPEFFRNFWVRRMALDRRNHKQVVDTTEELANKVGCAEIVSRVVDDLKDDSEPYRRMVMETTQRVLENLGAGDVDERLEERLIDGMLYAFQEQAVENADAASSTSSFGSRDSQTIMLDGFGSVVNALGTRCKPYLKQIAGTIKWRLNNKAASVRMQAADLIGRIAVVMKACGEDALMGHLGVVLYEYLGEEYPEVLGSILGALRAIVNVIGMTKMTPPIRDLLPRLTPILRNRHEKVQENCIDLVGRIADRGAEFVSAKEWMRICFELIELLKAQKKAIRRASVSTFGYIAKAIGPQDVLHTLLNNLKVQDRQMRVCTTVAIAIVAETCGPFTVLPALMNEYSVPELNIQNGVLKALSFMFEYIGDMGKDYIYAVTPLLEDALMDRDQVHRQTGCATVKHLALGVAGLGCEDALLHLMNFVWPNIFEESPHVIQAFFDAMGGLMVALGPNVVLQYTLQGLYHPARKVREVYWKVFNTLYIYAADALVMGYPVFEDEGENCYARTTLELFI